jgi:ABC-type sugar transport system permease subunit
VGPTRLLSRGDRAILVALIAVPASLTIALVWGPALASVVLSFTSWNGIGGLRDIQFIGLKNYLDLATAYPPFWPAVVHNLIWLAAYLGVATPFGILLAVLLDRELRGSRFYEGALYLPMVLSIAVVGLIWELQYAPEQGFINNALGTTRPDNLIDWLGDRNLNLWAVLVASGWRHVGYVVVLYLAGLRSLDPTLREAAAIDGATELQRFRYITFPMLRTVNVVVVAITVIEAMRAFDIVYVINRGLNGLELLSVLITNNILGEASRIGFGSAIATLLLVAAVGPIALYVRRTVGGAEA